MHYGLIVIFSSWIWQWYRFNRGHRSFDQWFLRLQALGLLIIALDTFKFSNYLTWFGVASLVVVLILIWKLRR